MQQPSAKGPVMSLQNECLTVIAQTLDESGRNNSARQADSSIRALARQRLFLGALTPDLRDHLEFLRKESQLKGRIDALANKIRRKRGQTGVDFLSLHLLQIDKVILTLELYKLMQTFYQDK